MTKYKGRFIAFWFLFFVVLSNAQGPNKMDCTDITPGVTEFGASKGVGYYSSEGQLLYVSNHKSNKNLIRRGDQSHQICILRSNQDQVTFNEKKDLEIDNQFTLGRNEIYRNSLILVFYLFVLVLIYFLSRGANFLNPFSKSKLPSVFNIPAAIILALMCSYIFEEAFFTRFGLVFVILLYKLALDTVMIKTLNVEMEIGNFIGNIFKFANLFFLGLLALKLSFNSVENQAIVQNYFVYLILVVFLVHTIRIILISNKNIKISQLIYYLCALEILPVLFLKEYYIL